LKRLLLLASLSISCAYNSLPVPIDCANSDLRLELQSQTVVTACNARDGTIRVTATGGNPPYTFGLGSISQTQGQFTSLVAGVYLLFVTDKNLCSDTLQVAINNLESDLSAGITVQPDTDCFLNNGIISMTGENGTPPFQYRIDRGEFSQIGLFDELNPGVYQLEVMDLNGCVFSVSVTVPQANTGISWRQDIKPIIDTRCAKAGCHLEGSGRTVIITYQDVVENRLAIKGRVVSRSMPFDEPLPDQQINMIACWIDDGALDN
jgi:hypothetical protein